MDSYLPLKNVTKLKNGATQECPMYETDCDKYESDSENYLPKELEDTGIEYGNFKNPN